MDRDEVVTCFKETAVLLLCVAVLWLAVVILVPEDTYEQKRQAHPNVLVHPRPQ
jgi:hypothetical protein